MSLETKDHAFWLHGSPHFLYGGEVHYFRIPVEMWEDRLQRVKDLGITTLSTYIPWLWHEPQSEHFDFDGHSHPQRNLQHFLELCKQYGLTVFMRPGPYVMAELRQQGLPAWIASQYPEVLARDAEGNIHPTGMVTYLHPTFLHLAHRWYRAVGDAVGRFYAENGGPIILTQLDNEVGMLHWVSGLPDSQSTVAKEYQDYLERDLTANASDYWNIAAFWREYRVRYLRSLQEEADNQKFPQPYVVNVHGFRDFSVYSRGVDYPIGLSQLADAARIPHAFLGGDFYPGHVTYDNFHDLALAVSYTRAVNSKDAAAFSPEFQSGRGRDRPHIDPSDFDLAARVSISYGLNGLSWYMLSAGENPEDIGIFGRRHDWQAPIAVDGTLLPSAVKVKHLGALLESFGSPLVLTHPVPDVHIGYYSPYYMTENDVQIATDSEKGIIQEIVHEREMFHFDGIYRLLIASNMTVNAVAIDVSQEPILPEQYPYLWVATTRFMDVHTQLRLTQFVKRGGVLILGPRIPEMDCQGRVCKILADELHLAEPVTYGQKGLAQILDWDSVYCPMYATFRELPGMKVLGRLIQNGVAKKPIIVSQSVNAGRVVLMGMGISGAYDYYLKVVRSLAVAVGCPPSLNSNNDAIHVTKREGPEGNFLFVHNFHDIPQTAIISTVTANSLKYSWTLTVLPRQGVCLPYGGVPLIRNLVKIIFTTAEITRNAADAVTIYRGTEPGVTRLSWDETLLVRPSVEVTSGQADITTDGKVLTIEWHHEAPAVPIALKWNTNDRQRIGGSR
jgi:beta-galactosidase